MPIQWKLRTNHVNSKALLQEVTANVESYINDNSVMWNNDVHRIGFISLLEDWFQYDLLDKKEVIEQFKIICDTRNNSRADLDSGKATLDIYYKQRHCLNTTHLQYKIEQTGEDIEFDIVFF